MKVVLDDETCAIIVKVCLIIIIFVRNSLIGCEARSLYVPEERVYLGDYFESCYAHCNSYCAEAENEAQEHQRSSLYQIYNTCFKSCSDKCTEFSQNRIAVYHDGNKPIPPCQNPSNNPGILQPRYANNHLINYGHPEAIQDYKNYFNNVNQIPRNPHMTHIPNFNTYPYTVQNQYCDSFKSNIYNPNIVYNPNSQNKLTVSYNPSQLLNLHKFHNPLNYNLENQYDTYSLPLDNIRSNNQRKDIYQIHNDVVYPYRQYQKEEIPNDLSGESVKYDNIITLLKQLISSFNEIKKQKLQNFKMPSTNIENVTPITTPYGGPMEGQIESEKEQNILLRARNSFESSEISNSETTKTTLEAKNIEGPAILSVENSYGFVDTNDETLKIKEEGNLNSQFRDATTISEESNKTSSFSFENMRMSNISEINILSKDNDYGMNHTLERTVDSNIYGRDESGSIDQLQAHNEYKDPVVIPELKYTSNYEKELNYTMDEKIISNDYEFNKKKSIKLLLLKDNEDDLIGPSKSLIFDNTLSEENGKDSIDDFNNSAESDIILNENYNITFRFVLENEDNSYDDVNNETIQIEHPSYNLDYLDNTESEQYDQVPVDNFESAGVNDIVNKKYLSHFDNTPILYDDVNNETNQIEHPSHNIDYQDNEESEDNEKIPVDNFNESAGSGDSLNENYDTPFDIDFNLYDNVSNDTNNIIHPTKSIDYQDNTELEENHTLSTVNINVNQTAGSDIITKSYYRSNFIETSSTAGLHNYDDDAKHEANHIGYNASNIDNYLDQPIITTNYFILSNNTETKIIVPESTTMQMQSREALKDITHEKILVANTMAKSETMNPNIVSSLGTESSAHFRNNENDNSDAKYYKTDTISKRTFLDEEMSVIDSQKVSLTTDNAVNTTDFHLGKENITQSNLDSDVVFFDHYDPELSTASLESVQGVQIESVTSKYVSDLYTDHMILSPTSHSLEIKMKPSLDVSELTVLSKSDPKNNSKTSDEIMIGNESRNMCYNCTFIPKQQDLKQYPQFKASINPEPKVQSDDSGRKNDNLLKKSQAYFNPFFLFLAP